MNKNIVIVDDDYITRMNIKNILEAKGYNVVGEASDGFDAIDVCKKCKADLVLLDIDMPILDGIKAAKILTKENLVDGIVLLTDLDYNCYIEKAKEVGAFGYMVKPVNEKNLIPTIEMCLSKIKEFNKLKNDLDKVNNKLNERKILEKAKGILVKEFNILEEEAYNKIRKLSMDRRVPMGEIAKIITVGYGDY
ncbi:ANTAR domain-containing response regulator [Clostridium tarantellae]|uniref:Stage 0 sporulation protein A homolog n=1 Tax=Clostridium tarantellae TaxID=39493 RepID=A0A6I1MKE3_9CLOT|nr:response regulator [Clostridium tarantellae]MPQ42908.1 response regulator [Clostridium tarantellae]